MKNITPDLKKWRRGLWVLLSGLFICSNGFASLEYHEVTVEGRGGTLGVAINEALAEAIGQVNGKAIEASSMLSAAELSTVKGNDAEYFASESFQRDIASATKGVVSSYEVLDSSETSGGRWVVHVCAKIGKYKRSAKSKRKRIAIMPLRVSMSRFTVNGEAFNKQEAVRLLGEQINARLVQSRRFTVLDRDYQQETLDEKSLILSGDVPTEEMARLGEELVADYIVVGTIEDIWLESREKKFPSGRTINSCGGTVSVSFRIIEIATRQVALASVVDVLVSCGTSSFSAVKILMPVADEVSEKILNAIYPLIVVQVSGDRVVLGQGGDGIKEGAHYKVYRYGERMLDPYNGEFLGREEIYCAEIEVERVLPKQAYARVVQSEVELASVFAPKTLVCRALSERDQKEKRMEERKEKQKSLENDW